MGQRGPGFRIGSGLRYLILEPCHTAEQNENKNRIQDDSTLWGNAHIYDPDCPECNPDTMIHTVTPLHVRYAETDQMGFAHHSHYATWFECGRVDMMNRIGIPYRDLEERGFLLPLLELGVRYIRSTTFDDRLEVHTFVRERPRAKIRIEYEISREGTLVSSGFTVHGFIDRDGRPMRPPPFFMEVIDRQMDLGPKATDASG